MSARLLPSQSAWSLWQTLEPALDVCTQELRVLKGGGHHSFLAHSFWSNSKDALHAAVFSTMYKPSLQYIQKGARPLGISPTNRESERERKKERDEKRERKKERERESGRSIIPSSLLRTQIHISNLGIRYPLRNSLVSMDR